MLSREPPQTCPALPISASAWHSALAMRPAAPCIALFPSLLARPTAQHRLAPGQPAGAMAQRDVLQWMKLPHPAPVWPPHHRSPHPSQSHARRDRKWPPWVGLRRPQLAASTRIRGRGPHARGTSARAGCDEFAAQRPEHSPNSIETHCHRAPWSPRERGDAQAAPPTWHSTAALRAHPRRSPRANLVSRAARILGGDVYVLWMRPLGEWRCLLW